MSLLLRPLTADDVVGARALLRTVFHDARDLPEATNAWEIGALERSVGAFDDNELVACGRTYPLELLLPGDSVVSVAGVTWIGVSPSHRRRGVLRLLLQVLHEDARDRGEPTLALSASEGGIYGRFGYGVATRRREVVVGSARSEFRADVDVTAPGVTRLVDEARARDLFPRAHERAWTTRPGSVRRPADWWADEFFDPPEGGALRTHAVHLDAAGEPDGFVTLEVKGSWERGVSRHRAEISDLVGATPAVRRVLWRFALDLDLVEEVRAWNLPVDEPIEWMLADPRRLATDGVLDELWLRVLDVGALVGGRSLGAASVVLEVRDEGVDPAGAGVVGPAHGRWRVEGGSGGGSCAPTQESADLTCGVRELGAALLGGVSWSTLARAGLVDEHASDAAARADTLFATRAAPHAGTWF